MQSPGRTGLSDDDFGGAEDVEPGLEVAVCGNAGLHVKDAVELTRYRYHIQSCCHRALDAHALVADCADGYMVFCLCVILVLFQVWHNVVGILFGDVDHRSVVVTGV